MTSFENILDKEPPNYQYMNTMFITHEMLSCTLEDRLNSKVNKSPTTNASLDRLTRNNCSFHFENNFNFGLKLQSCKISEVQDSIKSKSRWPLMTLIKKQWKTSSLDSNIQECEERILVDTNRKCNLNPINDAKDYLKSCQKTSESDFEFPLCLKSSLADNNKNVFTFDDVSSMNDDYVNATSDILQNIMATTTISADNPIMATTSTLDDILLLDCRSFISYNAGHVIHAHNVHFPNILQRRCKKKMIESVTRSFKDNIAADKDIDLSTTGHHLKEFVGNIQDRNVSNIHNIPLDFNFSKTCLYSGENSKFSKPPSLLISSSSSSSPSLSSSKPLMPLESIVTCEKTRKRLMSGDFDLIVIYDESVEHLEHNKHGPWNGGSLSEKLSLVMNTLLCSLSRAQLTKLRCLQDGYSIFAENYPHLIERKEMQLDKLSPPSSAARTVSPRRDRIKWSAHSDKGDPTEILPWLFLGSAYHADQTDRLHDLGVTALLNVASNETKKSCFSTSAFSTTHSSTFQQACIPLEDSLTSEIGCHFYSAIAFIEKVHQEKGKVLVHCSAGVSRSPAVCLAYLISTLGHTLETAYDFLRSKRACIAPNLNFMRQLQEFEMSCPKDKLEALSTLSLSACDDAHDTTDEIFDETKSHSPSSNLSFGFNLQLQLIDSDHNLNPSPVHDHLNGANHMAKVCRLFKKVQHSKKVKFMKILASHSTEINGNLKFYDHNIQRMLLQRFSKSFVNITVNNAMSKKAMFTLLNPTTSSSPLVAKNSSMLKKFASHVLLLADVEHPISSSYLSVINDLKKSDKKFSLMVKDFQCGVKKVKCRDKKGGIKFLRETCRLCRDSERNTTKVLCNYFVLRHNCDKLNPSPPNENINNIENIDSLSISSSDIKSFISISNDTYTSPQHETTSPRSSNVENETSPSKKARPSSLTSVRLPFQTFDKSLRPWLRVAAPTFPTSLPFVATSSLPQSPHSTQVHKFPMLTTSMGSLQQPYSNNLLPMLSTSLLEATSLSSAPQVHSKRKIIVSLLTPSCNQEAAFSFEPCQVPTVMGGLLPSPTICHSPLLSPS